MSSVKTLNPKAEVMGRLAALFMNINASKGLLDVMKTNLGPKGTIKMLVGGGGGAANCPHPHHRHNSPGVGCPTDRGDGTTRPAKARSCYVHLRCIVRVAWQAACIHQASAVCRRVASRRLGALASMMLLTATGSAGCAGYI